MYEQYFRLNGKPFLTTPDPEFIYWTDAHSYAFAMMQHGLSSRAPITVITGEIGAGKTTLLRLMLRKMPDEVEVGLLSNLMPERGNLLQWVMMALDQEFSDADSYVTLLRRFQDFAVNTYAKGRRTVLVIDEAQNLSVEQLEELRMLSNINADKDELLQLVLVAQPQLREKFALPQLDQFRQRIAMDFHLSAMNLSELENYIQHRLDIVGAQWRIFQPATCRLIHTATGGVPRLVNILCDFCLVYAYAAESKVVDEALVREFLTEARKRGIFQQFTPLPEAPALAARP